MIQIIFFFIVTVFSLVTRGEQTFYTVKSGENFFRIIINHLKNIPNVPRIKAFKVHQEVNRQFFDDFSKVEVGDKIILLDEAFLIPSIKALDKGKELPKLAVNPAPLPKTIGEGSTEMPVVVDKEEDDSREPAASRFSLANNSPMNPFVFNADVGAYQTYITAEDTSTKSKGNFLSSVGYVLNLRGVKNFNRKYGLYVVARLKAYDFNEETDKSFQSPSSQNISYGVGAKYRPWRSSIFFLQHGQSESTIIRGASTTSLFFEEAFVHVTSLRWSQLLFHKKKWIFSISPQISLLYPRDLDSFSIETSWGVQVTPSIFYKLKKDWTLVVRPHFEWTLLNTSISKQNHWEVMPSIGLTRSF